MRGARAKLYRKIAYGPDGDFRQREYTLIEKPRFAGMIWPTVEILSAGEKRHLYQSLKGRRGLPQL